MTPVSTSIESTTSTSCANATNGINKHTVNNLRVMFIPYLFLFPYLYHCFLSPFHSQSRFFSRFDCLFHLQASLIRNFISSLCISFRLIVFPVSRIIVTLAKIALGFLIIILSFTIIPRLSLYSTQPRAYIL